MTYGYDDRRMPPSPPAGPDDQSYYPPLDEGYDPFADPRPSRGGTHSQPVYEPPAYDPPTGYGPTGGYDQGYGQPPGYDRYPQRGYGQPAGDYGNPGYDQGGYGQTGYPGGYDPREYDQRGYGQTGGHPRAYPDDPGAYAPRSAPPRSADTGFNQRTGSVGVYGQPRSVGPHTETGGVYVPGPRDSTQSGQYSRAAIRDGFDPVTDTGSRRRAAPPPPPKRGPGRTIGVVLLVVVLVVGAIGGALWWTHRGGTTTVSPGAGRAPLEALADRVKDPKPLTVAEVYGPNAKIASTEPAGTYKVLGSQLSADCGVAVTDALVALLKTAGCNQVVRGTLTSPDGAYVITAGIFNLRDSSAATQVYGEIKTNVTTGKGRFTGFATGTPADVITAAQANLAWDSVGHYLVYCVIALANGQPIAKDDKATGPIITDVVEKYLGDKVVTGRVAATPSGSPS